MAYKLGSVINLQHVWESQLFVSPLAANLLLSALCKLLSTDTLFIAFKSLNLSHNFRYLKSKNNQFIGEHLIA